MLHLGSAYHTHTRVPRLYIVFKKFSSPRGDPHGKYRAGISSGSCVPALSASPREHCIPRSGRYANLAHLVASWFAQAIDLS